MDSRVFLLSFCLAGAVTVGSAAAGQHEGHQTGVAAPSAAQVSECRQAQPVLTGLLNAALKRLEDARLTNSAAAMRDAADDVQAALVDMRTQLAPCSAMQASQVAAPLGQVMPSTSAPPVAAGRTPATQPASTGTLAAPADSHAGHLTPAAPPTSTSRTPAASPARPAQRAAPASGDSHAGHTTPAAPASRTPAASAPRPSAPARPAAPAGDAHAGHATPAAASPATPGAPSRSTAPAPPTDIAELKCSSAVDPKAALRMMYRGRMYYFCTDASRAEFAKDPARFVTAPPEAAPAHAH